MGGGGSAPKPDPNIGIAALKSAELGNQYLDWAKKRAKTTDAWAAQDRSRQQKVFQPLQDTYIRDAKTFDSASRQRTAARNAAADVRSQIAVANGTEERRLSSMGVNPNSGRALQGGRSRSIEAGLAVAGAQNMAKRQIRAEGQAMRANAINMGAGGQVNPLSAFQAGSAAVGNGFQGAMSGYAQQGSLLNQQYQSQLQGWQASQQGSGLPGVLGGVAGMMVDPTKLATAIPFLSDENTKTKRRPARSLAAVRKLPDVEQWEYKAGQGDGGGKNHIGPMAQDFAAATGTGDGRTIQPVDAIGVTMGAVKELDKSVSRIARSVKKLEKMAA